MVELRLELRILGVVGQFRFFFGVQVIEIAEEFVEAVDRRQVFIPVANMVLPELPCRISERLQQLGDRWVSFCRPTVAPGVPTFVRPVRIGFWPQMKEARPAVQLC